MRATFQNLFSTLNVAAFVRTRHAHAVSVIRWILALVPMAAAVGTLCAAFLYSLDVATQARFTYPWLLFLLPAYLLQGPHFLTQPQYARLHLLVPHLPHFDFGSDGTLLLLKGFGFALQLFHTVLSIITYRVFQRKFTGPRFTEL